MERFILRVQSTSRLGNKPWYSPLLRRVAHQRHRLFCKAELLPRDHRLSVAYRKVRNWYMPELRAAERQYYLRLGSYLSSSQYAMDPLLRWWRRAKKACGLTATDSMPPLSVEGQLHVSPLDKAACLNSVFASQCSAPPSPPCQQLCAMTSDVFTFKSLSEPDVLKKLVQLDCSKSPGMNCLHNRVLKECASTLQPLTFMFNLSLQCGTFPRRWKSAIIQPIFSRTEVTVLHLLPTVLLPCYRLCPKFWNVW